LERDRSELQSIQQNSAIGNPKLASAGSGSPNGWAIEPHCWIGRSNKPGLDLGIGYLFRNNKSFGNRNLLLALSPCFAAQLG
jgi:hypothetical protein